MANSTIKTDTPVTMGYGQIYNGRVTNASVKWIKAGRVVRFSGYLKTTDSVWAGAALMVGFPPPLDTEEYFAGELLNTSASGNAPIVINAMGSLCTHSFRAPAANTNYAVEGMYISAK